MSEEQDEKRGFKVEDRRRFSESGDAREDVTPAAADEPARPEPAAGAAAATAAEHVAEPGEQHEHAHEHAHGPAPELSFSTFVLSLSTQALAHLGEIPDFMDGTLPRDLIAAKQLIDILGILDAKTKGNLDPAEAALLTNVLYDLRLKYVEQARRS